MPGPGSYWIGEEEKQEVLDVLESGHLSRYGQLDDPKYKQKVLTFEKEFASYVDVGHACANTGGTASIFIALRVLGFQPGDEIIVPTYGYVATYSAPIFAGLVPVLTEIDESLTMDPEDIKRRITPKTRAIMPVQMLGLPSDMDSIMDIANDHGLPVIEDACQAAGASYKGRKVGSFGKMSAFSLNVFKTITTGDGGILVTDDEELRDLAFGVQDHGYRPDDGWLKIGENSILGMNFRMNEMTGAVALAQLRKLDNITATLRRKKKRLKDAIDGIPGTKFRRVDDPEGECGTLCTVIFDRAEKAASVARTLGTTTVDVSAWHVYANMDHINRHLASIGRPHSKGAYPVTDDILSRSINLSVGVVDPGLGAAFGININSSDDEIDAAAEKFRQACSA